MKINNTTYSIRINIMKNMAVLKRFLSYIAVAVLGGTLFFSIMKLTSMYFGDPYYGLIGMLVLGFICFTWSMSASQVESELREARWAKERE